MSNYSNPMITYDEIVNALIAIIDCSKANGYLEEYGFLNIKYDSLEKNPMQKEQEQALLKALQSLEKTINAANKVIRENLEKELAEINSANIFTISSTYEHLGEKRKLASKRELVMRLKEMSLPLAILNSVDKTQEKAETFEDLPSGFEEIIETPEVIEPAKIEEPIYLVEEEIANSYDEVDEQYIESQIETEEGNFESSSEIEEETFEPQGEIEEESETVESNKIQLIRKALEKAREKGNEQLIKVLEIQLNKELDNLK